MIIGYKTLHKDFKFNGLSYSREELKHLGHRFIKEREKYQDSIGSFLLAWLDENDRVEVRTSGSTGKPKKILLRKDHMVNSALATGSFFKLNSKDSALLCLSADNIAGKMMLVRAMTLGLHLDVVEPSSNPLENVSEHYDFCAMVPLQLENSFEELDRIKTLIVGGASISNSLKVKAQNASCHIFETYGMTETITHVAVKKVNHVKSSCHHEPVEGVGETAFKAVPNVLFSVDERKCLRIDAQKVADQQIVTNDIVDLISYTEFHWLGRYDNIINSGGVKLFPEQIEAKLSQIISNRSFVMGLPDEQLGEKLVLIIEGEADIDETWRKVAVLQTLKKYEVPKAIHFLPEFLETDNGKIRRKDTANLIEV